MVLFYQWSFCMLCNSSIFFCYLSFDQAALACHFRCSNNGNFLKSGPTMGICWVSNENFLKSGPNFNLTDVLQNEGILDDSFCYHLKFMLEFLRTLSNLVDLVWKMRYFGLPHCFWKSYYFFFCFEALKNDLKWESKVFVFFSSVKLLKIMWFAASYDPNPLHFWPRWFTI